MKVKYIEVEIGVTKNLGNYESAKLAYRFGADLDMEESVKEAKETLRDHLIKEANADIGKVVVNKPEAFV